jgi:hypothetical protein
VVTASAPGTVDRVFEYPSECIFMQFMTLPTYLLFSMYVLCIDVFYEDKFRDTFKHFFRKKWTLHKSRRLKSTTKRLVTTLCPRLRSSFSVTRLGEFFLPLGDRLLWTVFSKRIRFLGKFFPP